MARSGGDEITREQLDALKEKFDLVRDDRRSFFGTYEATKRENEVREETSTAFNKDRASLHHAVPLWQGIVWYRIFTLLILSFVG